MPPTPGLLGEGEETAAYSSGCGKVTGEKAAIVCGRRVGAGSRSPRTLCSAQAPRPNSGSPIQGGWGRGLAPCLAPSAQIVYSGPHWGRGQTRGNESLTTQKAVLRPFPTRTSISVPQRTVRKLSQGSLSCDSVSSTAQKQEETGVAPLSGSGF